MAEEKGLTFSAEDVQNHVRTKNENEEFADVELTDTALMHVVGAISQIKVAESNGFLCFVDINHFLLRI